MYVKQHPVLRNKATPRAWRVTGRGIRALPLHSRRLFEFAPAVAAAVDVQWARFVRQVVEVGGRQHLTPASDSVQWRALR